MSPADEADQIPQSQQTQQTPTQMDDGLAFEPVASVPRRKRRWLRYVFLLIVLGSAGASAWYGYDAGLFGNKGTEIPIVRANQDPIKVKPASPGGMKVRDQDKLIFERLKPGAPPPSVERLLPKAESPIPPPGQQSVSPPDKKPVPQQPQQSQQSGQKAERLVPPPSPTKVEKITPKKMLPKQPVENEIKEKLRIPPPTVPSAKSKQLVKPKQKKQPSKQAKIFEKPKPEMEKLLPSPVNTYRIQLAAVRSQRQAEKEWARIQKKHQDLLGKLKLFVMRADLGAKGVYFRLRAGPLSSEAAAKGLCKKLAARKVGCLTVKPNS